MTSFERFDAEVERASNVALEGGATPAEVVVCLIGHAIALAYATAPARILNEAIRANLNEYFERFSKQAAAMRFVGGKQIA